MNFLTKTIKKITQPVTRHCNVCHKEVLRMKREHKCHGLFIGGGGCLRCTPDKKVCPMCGNIVVK